MKANELRLGNYYEYRVIDKVANTDTWELTAIDIDDLKWLLKNPDYPMYRPIRITTHLWSRIELPKTNGWSVFSTGHFIGVDCNNRDEVVIGYVAEDFFHAQYRIKYLHELQNIYFVLTGKELTINLEDYA